MSRPHWDVRPASCREFARAMYRAGQDRAEVKRRLHGMGRWSYGTVADALWWAEEELDIAFRQCPPRVWEMPLEDVQQRAQHFAVLKRGPRG